ncbi:LacI family transcriptional regulator [Pigmentiphaga sp. GD03639]|uniref:LacI family DNA-binding transcriptional regulator n=1 Tax=Pigmentiphaga sp. GD03639 TaxID=2975354 RepID=UPI00244C3E48|nr:LacI family DNA-binding transcriptional regulator [Pigmentiphaga sp. GD03639]MDH2238989.1 LacI family transcriptional regulator [Pigmentiphaga sp. GD03639]
MASSKPAHGPVTIKDIAAALGISHTTVSRALNDHPKLSDDTKARVRQAARELGYVLNASGRILRGGASPLVGLVIPDIQNDFYSAIAKRLAERCRDAGFQMVLAITEDDPDAECGEVQALIQARAAGIVITPSPAPLPRTVELLAGTPTVQLIRSVAALATDVVAMDDAAAAHDAAAHLLALGHRRIGYVGGYARIKPGRDRLRGFVKAHAEAGLEADRELIVQVPPRQEYGADAMRRLLAARQRPTAVVIGSSELTIVALAVIREHGLSTPSDISVVGYGDPKWYELTTPPLTAVRLPIEALAASTAELVFARIAAQARPGEPASAPRKLRIRPELIARGSAVPRR